MSHSQIFERLRTDCPRDLPCTAALQIPPEEEEDENIAGFNLHGGVCGRIVCPNTVSAACITCRGGVFFVSVTIYGLSAVRKWLYGDCNHLLQHKSGDSCLKYQGETVPCDCGGYVFTASSAGICDYNRQVCNWWVKWTPLLRGNALRQQLLAKLYVPDCRGNIHLLIPDSPDSN